MKKQPQTRAGQRSELEATLHWLQLLIRILNNCIRRKQYGKLKVYRHQRQLYFRRDQRYAWPTGADNPKQAEFEKYPLKTTISTIKASGKGLSGALGNIIMPDYAWYYSSQKTIRFISVIQVIWVWRSSPVAYRPWLTKGVLRQILHRRIMTKICNGIWVGWNQFAYMRTKSKTKKRVFCPDPLLMTHSGGVPDWFPPSPLYKIQEVSIMSLPRGCSVTLKLLCRKRYKTIQRSKVQGFLQKMAQNPCTW